MTGPGWSPDWVDSAAPARRELWRGVEAQHQVATLRLVDDLDEQAVLEQLLEDAKPPLPPAARNAHYLLSTPFRYRPPWPSRFRLPEHAGAWYGADAPATVAAELAHWRWRFLMDSEALRGQALVAQFTFFQARFDGLELDLGQPPWVALRATWRDPADHAGCQALAAHLRAQRPQVQAVRYESARLEGGWCAAVFDPRALRITRPDRQQTWVCKATADRVLFTHDDERLQFEPAQLRVVV